MSKPASGTTARANTLTKASMGIAERLALEASPGGIDDLRRDVQMLLDIEAIKQLKHAYFRCIDTANWGEIEELFHDDVSVHFIGSGYEWKLQGKPAYVEATKKTFHREMIGHHNGHHPEIQVLSDTEATGIWYLADNMWILNEKAFTTGTALYWDRYLKVDGRWTIKDSRYERIYQIDRVLDENPVLGVHYLGVNGSTRS